VKDELLNFVVGLFYLSVIVFVLTVAAQLITEVLTWGM
jgi:hypothetical protein